MSLILEALRKSEAERRRAQAPDLFAPAQVAVAPARRLPPAWMLAAAALALLVLAWLASRAFWPGSPARELSVATAVNDTPIDRAPVGDTPVETAAVDRISVDRTPVGRQPAASAPDVATMPTRAAATGRGDAISVATPPTAPASPRRLPAPNPVDARNAVATTSPIIEPTPANADSAAIANDPPEVMPAAPVATRTTPPPVADASGTPGLDAAAPPMRLSELPTDARRQLPPLKLTMHMWNEAPDRRFVILDGRRIAEGDRVGAARVAEIHRDGVILDWNGQRLELPLH